MDEARALFVKCPVPPDLTHKLQLVGGQMARERVDEQRVASKRRYRFHAGRAEGAEGEIRVRKQD